MEIEEHRQRQTDLNRHMKITHAMIGTTKLVTKYFLEKMVSSAEFDPWTITSLHMNGTIMVQRGTKSE